MQDDQESNGQDSSTDGMKGDRVSSALCKSSRDKMSVAKGGNMVGKVC